ncbi:hypothetical protein FRC02_010019 [Tulasnella sp. 418]|nr:hypothetical protein FRC02_010019 [Tulasnella sp. 418]
MRSLLSIHPNRERHTDPLARLRFAIETMATSRKYQFTQSTRAEVLTELYSALWGPYSNLFLPPSHGPLSGLLSEAQRTVYPTSDTPQPGRTCGRIFKKGDSCYRCRDCGLDDSTVLCAQCFSSSIHAGHNVSFYIAVQPGGVCDCGETEAWKQNIHCSLHPVPESSNHGTPKSNPNRSAAIVDQWAIRNRATVPHELREFMSRTVAYALDFVLDTLDFSPDEMSVPQNEQDLKKQPTADPVATDLFAIVVWNDEKHSFDECAQHIKDATGCSLEDATETTTKIDQEGRDIVQISSQIPLVLSTARQIANIDMAVTVRRAYDTFREQVSAVIVEWLVDLMQCRLANDAIILREVVAAEVYAPRKKDSSSLSSNQEATKVLAEIKDAARLDWLLLYHVRLWKRARLNLKHILVSMLTINHEHRLTVAVHFSNVYHRIIDAYLLVDREAETSIKYFAVQIFTIPSVAAYIVRHNGIISRLLAIITGFFTNYIVNKRIVFPPDMTRRVEIDSYPFRSKRFMPVFSDLRYICTNRTIQEMIANHHDYIAQFITVCQIFMGINPNKRAASTHVEYETESWISVFNVTLSLSRVVKVYGESFQHGTPRSLLHAITAVIHAILSTCTLSNDQLDKTKYQPIAFHTVEFGDTEYQVVTFDVLSQWVSFHHSLHWLLAELFKHVHLLDEESLRSIEMESLTDMVLKNASERAILTVLDFPLRVIAMVAQIRVGLWVRNGFAIRGQLLHYRDFMLRELCYDQDLYILQTCFVILDPNLVIVSMLERFQLLHWFTGATAHAYYDGAQLFGMVEEFLYIIITVLSEFANARHLTPVEVVRRELIHGLALGPCAFTDLCKRVAERIVDDMNLDKALAMVANYRPPTGTTDFGTYELKEELFDEVNPFFYHYTRNRREEVEGILKARLTKKSGDPLPVIVPRPFNVRSGPFTTIPSVFRSEVLLQVVFYTIHNILEQAGTEGAVPSGDAVIDQGLHLVMLGLVEQHESFAHLAAQKGFEAENRTLVDELCVLEYHDNFKAFRPKVKWCLDQITQHEESEVLKKRKMLDKASGPDAETAKKQAAKARQAAIMKQFAAAQKSFLDQYDDEDEEDETMNEEEEEEKALGPCIVCQDNLDSTRAFGVLGFIQPSRIVKVMPTFRAEDIVTTITGPTSLDRHSPPPPPHNLSFQSGQEATSFGRAPSDETRFGLYGSVCGHLMHLQCFAVYSTSIEQRHISQPTRNHPEVVERKEFLCPLCKSLGNVLLPVHCRLSSAKARSQSNVVLPPLPDWLRSVGIEVLRSPAHPRVDGLLRPDGSGELVFWNAEDSGSTERPLPRVRTFDTRLMLETLRLVSVSVSEQTQHLRERPEPEPGERGSGMYLPEEMISYTIACMEIAQRGIGDEGTLIIDNINESALRAIRGLVACMELRTWLEFPDMPDNSRLVVSRLILKRLLPEWTREAAYDHPLLLRDTFTVLVEIAIVCPEVLEHVVVLTYYAFVARTAIGLIELLAPVIGTAELPDAELEHADLFGDVKIFTLSVCRHSQFLEDTARNVLGWTGKARFARLLYAHTLPFLRRALLLIRSVHPGALGERLEDPTALEYHRIMKVLKIPPLSEITQHQHLRSLMSGWCSHFGARHNHAPMQCEVLLEFPNIHRLATLPLILDTIFLQPKQTLTCKRCCTVPVDPAICLICGTICCHQSHCCIDLENEKQGECNMHMRECGGAIGVYFLLKRCMVLYLYAGNGSFATPPYLDIHGEFDYMMRRGRRQLLHPQRFDEIRKTWLNHGIPTLTARKLDTTIDSGGWDTV